MLWEVSFAFKRAPNNPLVFQANCSSVSAAIESGMQQFRRRYGYYPVNFTVAATPVVTHVSGGEVEQHEMYAVLCSDSVAIGPFYSYSDADHYLQHQIPLQDCSEQHKIIRILKG